MSFRDAARARIQQLDAELGRQICSTRAPACDLCPLNDLCPAAFQVGPRETGGAGMREE